MKLVEILARELKEWPEDCTVVEQAIDGDICAHRDSTKRNFRHLGISITLAEDWMMAFVTRAQWEAERDRLAAMDGNQSTLDYFINNFEVKDGRAYHKETGYVWVPEMSSELGKEAEDWRAEAKKQYEQELWDKVAARRFNSHMELSIGRKYASREAFDDADAFMAERAKRLKK